MCGEPRPKGTFKIYAVEGGTAAMCYIFKSLKSNRILNPGDTIAMGVPIFTPYLEMAHLEDYDLHYVEVHAKQDHKFQYPDAELDKLLDPRSRRSSSSTPATRSRWRCQRPRSRRSAPCSETAGSDPADRRRLRHIRAGLPLADGRVPEEHHRRLPYSNTSAAPAGAPGHDRRPRGQHLRRDDRRPPGADQATAGQALRRLTLEPRKFAFIDRIVADSRDIALNHTAGLSLPQQVMMSLFSLSELMDTKKDYQACIGIVKKRVQATIEGLDIEVGQNATSTTTTA